MLVVEAYRFGSKDQWVKSIHNVKQTLEVGVHDAYEHRGGGRNSVDTNYIAVDGPRHFDFSATGLQIYHFGKQARSAVARMFCMCEIG